jgi:hypothetical protein
MATRGYDPYRTLWHIYNESKDVDRPLTPEQVVEIEEVVTALGRGDPGDFLWRRFENAMGMAPNSPKFLDPDLRVLTQGLLECIAPRGTYIHPKALFGYPGIYDHFKGGIYLLTGFNTWVGRDAEEPAVEYLSMLNGRKFGRTVAEWCEVVQWPDHLFRQRWVYRGPDLRVEAPSFKVSKRT